MAVVESIPAITLWQPWATLVARGLKVHETRSWWPPAWLVGKRLAIHAGAHYTMAHEVSDALSDILDREHLNSMPMALGAAEHNWEQGYHWEPFMWTCDLCGARAMADAIEEIDERGRSNHG
jgi:hypothetical protein